MLYGGQPIGSSVYGGLGVSALDPKVATLEASNVDVYSVRLNGELTDLGNFESVLVKFEYRIKGEATWSETTGLTLTDTQTYYEDVSGLEAETLYEFRAKVEYEGDSYSGFVKEFTTLPIPTVISGIVEIEGSGVEGATVLMINQETLNVRTRTTDVNGEYEFDFIANDIDRTAKYHIVVKYEDTTTGEKYNAPSYFDIDPKQLP